MANKNDIVAAVAEKHSTTKAEAARILSTVLGTIEESLIKGEDVTLTGFGSLKVTERAERAGRNPQTGEALVIPARKAVTFKPGKSLKEAVNE